MHFLITTHGPFLDPWHFNSVITVAQDSTVGYALRLSLRRLASNSLQDRAKVLLVKDMERQHIIYLYQGGHRVVHPMEPLYELEHTDGAIALTFQVAYNLIMRESSSEEEDVLDASSN